MVVLSLEVPVAVATSQVKPPLGIVFARMVDHSQRWPQLYKAQVRLSCSLIRKPFYSRSSHFSVFD